MEHNSYWVEIQSREEKQGKKAGEGFLKRVASELRLTDCGPAVPLRAIQAFELCSFSRTLARSDQ